MSMTPGLPHPKANDEDAKNTREAAIDLDKNFIFRRSAGWDTSEHRISKIERTFKAVERVAAQAIGVYECYYSINWDVV